MRSVVRQALGVQPNLVRNQREKALGAENPSKRATSFKERTDVTAVPAMGVVAEAMVALVLAGEALRKFGGDSVAEFTRNHAGFVQSTQTLG